MNSWAAGTHFLWPGRPWEDSHCEGAPCLWVTRRGRLEMRRRPDCPQEGLEGRRLRGPHPALAGGISNQNSCLASLLAALPLHPVVSAALGGLRNAACSAPSPRSLPCLHRGRRPSLGVSHQTSERRAPGSHPAARPSEGPGAPAPEWQGEQPGTQGSVCLLLSSFRWDNSWDRKLCLFTRSTFSYGAPAYPGGSHCPRPWGVRGGHTDLLPALNKLTFSQERRWSPREQTSRR